MKTSEAIAWHALDQANVLARLEADPKRGLSAGEAQRRLLESGPNRLPEASRRSGTMRLLLQFHNPLIYVLLAAAVVTALLGDYIDAAVIVGVVLINAAIGYVQEGKAEQALEAVRGMLASHATVMRDGVRLQIDAAELVPGDLVLLEPGDRVPADLRIVHAHNLRATEAALTGESMPSEKQAAPVGATASLGDRASMLYSGTLVASGLARAVVVATGTHSEIGRIGSLVGGLPPLATPLTRRLDHFAMQITVVTLVVAAFSFAWGILIGGMAPLDVFLAVVGLAVAAIPEGLPAIITIVLAIGTRRMARQRAIVRRLPAVESLGSVTVICSDKTGTLTRNEMTVVRLMLPDGEVQVSGSGYAPIGGFHRKQESVDPLAEEAIVRLARCALLCNDASLRRSEDAGDGWQLVGDPTEGALLTLGHKTGFDTDALLRNWPRLDEIGFESERRYMATLHADTAGAHWLLIKGAPERVLALCDRVAGGGGRHIALDAAHWDARVTQAAGAGERVLALACCPVPDGQSTLTLDDIHRRFELLGMVGIIDPPREEAIAAIDECRRAGIRVKMITGDHAATAAAIGARIGLPSAQALSGDQIDGLDDAALMAAIDNHDVIARASPDHKLRLIAALQARGHQVAMTGDGVNDAPALKAADIGVAMGNKGTDAAREASDLVLTDDNFATIARAVREGRVVFDNIKKALLFILPTNGGEAGVILLAIFAGLSMPVTAGQILWVNMVTAVTLALALAFEPPEHGVMDFPPRAPREPLITRALGLRILYVSLLMVVTTFAVFEWELARGSSLEVARTAAVNMLVAGELVYLFNTRHFTQSSLRVETLVGNPVVLWVCGVLIVLQLLFTYAAPMQQVFRSAPLDLASWSVIGAFALAKFLAVELEKAVWRARGVRRM